MIELIGCPVDTTLKIIGKKWTINLINDLLFGRRRFTQFLESNSGLSAKVLSARLRDLVHNGIITKKVTSVDPVVIEYELTDLGKQLRYLLFEIAYFSTIANPDAVLQNPSTPKSVIASEFGKMYGLNLDEIRMRSTERSVTKW